MKKFNFSILDENKKVQRGSVDFSNLDELQEMSVTINFINDGKKLRIKDVETHIAGGEIEVNFDDTYNLL